MSIKPTELHDKQLLRDSDGDSHELLSSSPNTEVLKTGHVDDAEEAYWADLATSGLIEGLPIRATNVPHFDPVIIEGEPLSETIINNRR
jgi:hypothetical protein